MYSLSTISTSSYQYSTTPRNSRLKLPQTILDSARERLLGQNPPEGGVILDRNISLESYVKYRETEEDHSVQIRLLDGEIIAYELPLKPHGSAVIQVSSSLYSWSNLITGSSEDDLIIAPNSYFTADCTFGPRNLPPPLPNQACNSLGDAYPNMVLEVGNLESLRSLHGLAPFYLSQRTPIMIYLAIKLYPPRAQQPRVRPMVAMLYRRTSQTPFIPTRVISFGNAPLHNRVVNFFTNLGVPNANFTGVGIQGAPPCNAANIPMYQLPISAAELFHRTPRILPAVNFHLDLWQVQDRVLNPY
jgi:hypothetical protein